MRGVVYIASGEEYIAEARRSVASLKRHTDFPVTLFTDGARVTGEHFDQVLPITGSINITMKARALHRTPYEQTLYLDTDTYILSDISGIFDALNRCDVAAAYAPRRHGSQSTLPDWFPEVNGGVLLFGHSVTIDEWLDRWLNDLVAERRASHRRVRMEQPALRRALYTTPNMRLLILPPEYNMRIPMPTFVARKVHILHGRGEMLEAAIEKVNERQGMRVWLPLEKALYKGR